MDFTNIDEFEQRMANSDISTSFFSIQYHCCVIECAYSINQKKFLFAFVDHNIGFTCSLNGSYANGFINHIEAVNQLKLCRNHGKLDPIHFYEFLNSQLSSVNIAPISTNQYVKTLSQAVSAFEDRIYFNHWRSANISEQQRNKAIELMGYKVVEFCDENKLTPVFYDTPTERTLKAFDDFAIDYSSNGLKKSN